jgi:hypothetical protein
LDGPVIVEFEQHALYQAMENHLKNHVPWEETKWYQWVGENPGVEDQYNDVPTMKTDYRTLMSYTNTYNRTGARHTEN